MSPATGFACTKPTACTKDAKATKDTIDTKVTKAATHDRRPVTVGRFMPSSPAATGKRPADHCRDDPDRQLDWRHDRARDEIAEHQECRAKERGGRQHDAMIRADEQPHQVRDHDADEADRAGQRNGGAGRQRRAEKRDPLRTADVDASAPATSSPSVSRFSVRGSSANSANATAISGTAARIGLKLLTSRLPSSQRAVRYQSAKSIRYCTNVMSAEKNVLSVTPASSSTLVDSPPLDPRREKVHEAGADHGAAEAGRRHRGGAKRGRIEVQGDRAHRAQRGAAETPSVNGVASGLRSSACSTTPAAASVEPTSAPASTRGRRATKKICASTLSAQGIDGSKTRAQADRRAPERRRHQQHRRREQAE